MQPDLQPPADMSAEQATLGSILIEPGAAARAFAVVSPADFYWSVHQRVASAMEACYQRREALDLITVGAELRRRGHLDEVGGAEYLTALVGSVPTAAHVTRYAGIVAEKAVLRDIILRTEEIRAQAQANPDDVGTLLADAGQRLTDLYQQRVQRAVLQSPVQTFTADTERLWAHLQSDAPRVSSARFGVGVVDRDLGGLEAQRLVVIKADTKHGKSQLTRQLVLTSARHFQRDGSGRVAVMFILEEGYWPWHQKAIAWLSGVDSMALIIPGWGKRLLERDEGASQAIVKAEAEWAGLPLRISASLANLGQIVATCRALALEVPIGLVAIDYFQLLTGMEPEARTEEQVFNARAQKLQRLADELECPVICPSQVTVDRDSGKANTKGARAIEHNASLVVDWKRDEDGGELKDSGYMACLISRNTPSFRPQKLITDKRCGRFWDAEGHAEALAYERERSIGTDWHDNG